MASEETRLQCYVIVARSSESTTFQCENPKTSLWMATQNFDMELLTQSSSEPSCFQVHAFGHDDASLDRFTLSFCAFSFSDFTTCSTQSAAGSSDVLKDKSYCVPLCTTKDGHLHMLKVRTDSPKDSSVNDVLHGYIKPRPTLLRAFTITIYILATVFLILVEIGNINNNPVIRSTYFLKIELANIIPASVPNAVFINSIAQSIGLHDFYQVGLWNFCEGYNGQGITHCSKTQTLYWFNPVEIILNELLSGASITLPSEVVNVLHLVQLASAWMFSCFLVGACLTFLCIFFSPLGFSKKPRWQHKAKRIFFRQLPITFLTFAALLFTAVASVVATVMFVIFRDKFSGAADLNIGAYLGEPMLAFMWIATGLNLVGFIMQIGTCCGVCCCTGRKKAVRKSQMYRAESERGIDEREKESERDGVGSAATGSPRPGGFGSRFRRR